MLSHRRKYVLNLNQIQTNERKIMHYSVLQVKKMQSREEMGEKQQQRPNPNRI